MTDTASAPASGVPGTLEVYLLDQVPAAVVVADLDGLVTLWNREAEAIFGWTREEAIGRHVTEVTTPPEGLAETARGSGGFGSTGR